MAEPLPAPEPSTPSEASANPSAPAAAPTGCGEEFQPLDPRVIRLWRVRQSIGAAVFGGVLLFPAVFAGFLGGHWLVAFSGWLVVAGLLAWRVGWHPPRAYRGWGYRLDEKVLEIREGIWFRTLTLLPLSRLQHVDLNAGPLERSMGLASLVFHTAGTHDAIIVLPGLDANYARELRDYLVTVGGDDGV